MPNWCGNTLKVYGEGQEMTKFQKKLKIKDGCVVNNLLSKFVPLPKELGEVHSGCNTIDGKQVRVWLEIDGKSVAIPKKVLDGWQKKYGATNWYDFGCNQWGTKWDVDADVNDYDAEWIELMFDSAWSPPMEWFENVVRDYPSLDFTLKYEEEGNGYLGVAKGKDGYVNDQCIEY